MMKFGSMCERLPCEYGVCEYIVWSKVVKGQRGVEGSVMVFESSLCRELGGSESSHGRCRPIMEELRLLYVASISVLSKH